MIRAYLAGPLTGDGSPETMERNVNAALDAQARLEDAGFAVHCPHLRWFLHRRHPRSYQHHMDQDREWLVSCEVFVRLPGSSPGSDHEEHLARSIGLAVYTVEEAINDLGNEPEVP